MIQQKVVEIRENTLVSAVKQFLTLKKQNNKNTYVNYLSDVEHFFNTVFGKPYKFVTPFEFDTDKTSLDGLIRYFDYLYDSVDDEGKRLFSNSTINRKQSSIKSLLTHLKIKKVYSQDLSELSIITNKPKDTKSIEVVNFDTAMRYAEWLRTNERNKGHEKYLIILLACDSGLRAVEILNLTWNHFRVEENDVLMSGYGKNNKKWFERISFKFYNEILTLKGDSDSVFSLSYTDVARMMNRAKKALGDDDKAISFHSFKKCAVTSAYRRTGDILEAQRKGRHESLDTTRLYLQAEDYGVTGMVSLGDNVDADLYKTVDKRILIKAMGKMNKDFLFILNNKIKEIQEKKRT